MRDRQGLARFLVALNKALTILGYIAYPALLVMLFFFDKDLLARCIAAPAASFVIVSVFRYIYDEKRPYETYEFTPIIDKNTAGKSFPSRHTFCMFMIAFSWMTYIPAVGITLALSGCVMAAIRVLCGVHYIRDVVAGALFAAIFAVLGYCAIP